MHAVDMHYVYTVVIYYYHAFLEKMNEVNVHFKDCTMCNYFSNKTKTRLLAELVNWRRNLEASL